MSWEFMQPEGARRIQGGLWDCTSLGTSANKSPHSLLFPQLSPGC